MKSLTPSQKDQAFDLVLLDMMMPRMSGYEVCQKLREKYPANELPMVMLIAKNRVEDLVVGFRAGANAMKSGYAPVSLAEKVAAMADVGTETGVRVTDTCRGQSWFPSALG